MQPPFKCFQEPCRIVCEKQRACIRPCLSEQWLLHHADLQRGTTVGLEETICWQRWEHVERGVTKTRRRGQSSKGGILANVPHRWLNEAPILYLYLLITYCAWLHTFSCLAMPTLLKRWICFTWNNTSPFFTPSNLCQQHGTMDPLFMDWQFKSVKPREKVRREKDRKLPLLSFTFTVHCLFVCGNWAF